MAAATTVRRPTPLLDALLVRLAQSRDLVHQERPSVRPVLLTLGSIVALGRHTLRQVLVAMGGSGIDWTASYRLFSRGRIAIETAQQAVVRSLLAEGTPGEPLPVVLDATQLPRSSRIFPGVGLTKAPRTPVWRPGIHLAQRGEVLSGLLPRADDGDSRAVPIRATYLRSRRTTAIGDVPPQSEGAAGIALLTWVRSQLTADEQASQPVLALADGADSTAPVIANLPPDTWLLARCAQNRALFAIPTHDPHRRGRKRISGDRGATPRQTPAPRRGWTTVTVAVRGRAIPLTVAVTGPWLIYGAPNHPLMLIVVKGIEHGKGNHRRQRDPQYFPVSAQLTADGEATPPLPRGELLAWARQRWEVEAMHPR